MTFKPFLNPEDIAVIQTEEKNSDKKQKRTPEQIEAIYTFGNNVLVSASAGSGKTFVMVERILDKLLRGVPIDSLFISTFTVKAAGELKERLEKKINESLKSAESDDLKQFLTQQLVSIQTADIGTMDAFTQKIVNQYGYTLGISPIFRILQDKNEQDVIKNEVYADLFSDYMTGKNAASFIKLVKNFSGNRKDSKAFREMVYKVYAFSQSTDNPKHWMQTVFLKGAQTYTDFEAIPDQEVSSLLNVMQTTANQLRDLTDQEDYKQLTAKGVPTANYKKHLKIIENLVHWSQDFNLLYGKKGLANLARDITNVIPSGNDVTVAGVKYPIFKQLHNRIVGLKHLEVIFKYQGESLFLLELLQSFVLDFSEQYLQEKIQENAFEFSDIAHFAIQILEENHDIRQLYQDKYHEVMVDEYQDNNHTQERMLELLSNGHNRFMVGDIKQSIYRFRQADPQIFNDKYKAYQDNPSQGKLIILKENFRSQSEVLDSTNSVFTHLMDEEVGDILYDESHQLKAGSPRQQERHPNNKTQVLLLDTDEDEIDDSDSQQYDISPAEAKLVAKEIIRLHKEENVPFQDITLLVSSRTRNDGILQTFDRYGIPLVTDGGEQNYLKSVEVMVMLDTLRSIDNPLNDYALVALLRSPMFGFNEDDLTRIAIQDVKMAFYHKVKLSYHKEGHHSDLITPELSSKIDHFMKTFQTWRDFAKWHSLYDLIWKIYNDRFYYDYVGALPKAEQRQANLYALALRANQFEKTGFKGLSRFIRMIDKVLENENDLADVEVALPQNAVNLMTIHKSKGLEFKYVFILNIDKKFSMVDITSPLILSRNQGIGIKYVADMRHELEEEILPAVKVSMETLPYQLNKRELRLATLSEQMRLLYVAMTRAEKKLYLVGKASQTKWADHYDLVSENNHLPLASRETFVTFQDWLLAVHETYKKQELFYDINFVSLEELTDHHIGMVNPSLPFNPDNKAENRQSEDIVRAISVLESVEQINQTYKAAIELPTVRTPSQVKKFYEPILDIEGVDVMETITKTSVDFKLPDFSTSKKQDPAALGSAVHELMQRIEMSSHVKMEDIQKALTEVNAETSVKAAIQIEKINYFFQETSLGKYIQEEVEHLHREAPFAMLKEDPESGEKFVVRGIIDGYLLLENRIILFDYKTDKFVNPLELKERYQGQMALYAEALKKSYEIEKIDKYLILLGGKQLEVVKMD